jgi:hypothetical protein
MAHCATEVEPVTRAVLPLNILLGVFDCMDSLSGMSARSGGEGVLLVEF